ncbi:hypothetical protein F5Y16DRAFT_381400 [Xylariaceae sp. FL0255]|nr:hypothetical protein F5Y16DRAFT_381400 [Xylariaceae sp. FL0255]
MTQTWCCPSGYSCPSAGWESLFTGYITPTRFCSSLIASSAVVYLRDGTSTYTAHILSEPAVASGSSSGSIRIGSTVSSLISIRPVFPLEGSQGSQSVRITGGKLAGVIVGSILGFLLLCLGLFLLRRYLIRQRDHGQALDVDDEKKDREAEATHGAVAELPTPAALGELHGSPSRRELESPHRVLEIQSSHVPIAELPAEGRWSVLHHDATTK